MATPLSRAGQIAAQSSGALRAKRIADLKKAMSKIDAAAESLPGGKTPLAPESQPFDVKPVGDKPDLLLGVVPKDKPFKKPKPKPKDPASSDDGWTKGHLLKTLARAEKEGDLVLTENGWVDAWGDNKKPLTEKQLNSKLYELGDTYATLDALDADGGGTTTKSLAAEKTYVDPWADIGASDSFDDLSQKFPLLGPEPVSWAQQQADNIDALVKKGVLQNTTSGIVYPAKDGGSPMVIANDEGMYHSDVVAKLAAQHLGAKPPAAPKGWDVVGTSTGVGDNEWARLTRARTKLPEHLQRQPGESIREYVGRIKEADPAYQAAARTEIEGKLAADVQQGRVGKLLPEDLGPGASIHNQATRDYIDYLAAHNVDQRTLDSIASGDLPMDLISRHERAREMGLDPAAEWYRWDYPFKTEFKGWTGAALPKRDYKRQKQGTLKFIDLPPKSEGIVYASHNPSYAELGAQMPADRRVLYPLLGPDSGIAGIDELPPESYDAFDGMQLKGLLRKYPGDANASMRRKQQRSAHLAEPLGDNLEPSELSMRSRSLDKLGRVGPDTQTTGSRYETIPQFSMAENRKVYSEPLMASGAKGTLVKDETGISTAFTPAGAQQLRRADLAPLDPRFKNARNILQSLLIPSAIAAGAATDGQR